MNLDSWFEGMGGKDVQEVVVRQPSFFAELDETMNRFTLDDWKTYLTWRVISSRAPLLSNAFANESFEFTGKTLFGTPEIQPRWKRGVAMVESALGEAVGKLYVAKALSARSEGAHEGLGRRTWSKPIASTFSRSIG